MKKDEKEMSLEQIQKILDYRLSEGSISLKREAGEPKGLTSEEACVLSGLNYTSASARFSELKKAGKIALKKIGVGAGGEILYERRLTRSHCTAAVLVLAVPL
jgi:hypothetical protein